MTVTHQDPKGKHTDTSIIGDEAKLLIRKVQPKKFINHSGTNIACSAYHQDLHRNTLENLA
jgi:hypothetical protein